jgi:hypothetical protein
MSSLQKRGWLAAFCLAGALGLTAFQAWAYAGKLQLSLGPRVILEPWLLRRGFVIYEGIADLHTPLMPLILATLAPLFRNGFDLAKLALIVLLSLTTLLTFFVGKQKIGWLGGLGAAFFLVIWSPAFGFGKLWHESFLAPIYLVWLLSCDAPAKPRRVKDVFLLGVLGGVSILIKQQAALVFAAFIVWNGFIHWSNQRSVQAALREAVLLGISALLPISIFCVYQYARAGSLTNFLYWTVGYPITSDYKTLTAIAPTLAQWRTMASSILLVPAAILCLIDSMRKGNQVWLSLAWGMILLATSSFTAYPRFNFFHLQASLPVLAFLSAQTFAYGLQPGQTNRTFPAGVAIALSFYWILTAGYAYRPVLHTEPQPLVFEYSDLVPLAEEIRQQIGPEDCIYIFPDDEATSNLYYLLDCLPPRFWIFHYPWYMLERIKHRILSTLAASPPEWVVYIPGRWGTESSAPEVVNYIHEHYEVHDTLDWAQGEVRLLKRVR